MNNTNRQNNGNGQFKQNLGYEARWGYLNSVRRMPGVSPTVLCVKIDVPYGRDNQGNALYEKFDLIVKSADAFSLFDHYFENINDDDNRVTVRFSTYGNKARAYVAQSGDKKGEIISYIAGKLGHLFNMRINGHFVHGGNGSDMNASEEEQSFEEQDVSSLSEHEKLLAQSKYDGMEDAEVTADESGSVPVSGDTPANAKTQKSDAKQPTQRKKKAA